MLCNMIGCLRCLLMDNMGFYLDFMIITKWCVVNPIWPILFEHNWQPRGGTLSPPPPKHLGVGWGLSSNYFGAFDPVRVPPLWNFGISDGFYFFGENEIILWGKKRTALSQTSHRCQQQPAEEHPAGGRQHLCNLCLCATEVEPAVVQVT